MIRLALVAALATIMAASPALAQPGPTPAEAMRTQAEAMAKLAALDGVWRGDAWMINSPGETPIKMVETIRVGPALDGALRVIEIRGYLPDGKVGFHAFNTVSFDVQKGAYVMNARAQGRSGLFFFEPTPDGYRWRIGGPDAGLHYTATVKDGVWTERGESVAPGKPAVAMSEMKVRRVGTTPWPDGYAPGPK
jgi:hypothetical protein